MGVVPPKVEVNVLPQQEARDWHKLLFALDPAKNVLTNSVLRAPKDPPWEVLIDITLCDSVYYPDAVGHPAFECM